MSTIFGRTASPARGWDDEGIYQRARAIVDAEIQLITYRDFLPILLGPNALTTYAGYNESVDPRVSIAFSAAAFRLGHTYLPSVLMRLNKRDYDRRPGFGKIDIPTEFDQQVWNRAVSARLGETAAPGGRRLYCRCHSQFPIQGTTGFDLLALDIQRGRDVGLPGYNQTRIDFGLAPKTSFAEMTSNMVVQGLLAQAYTSPDDVDLFIGGLVEDHVNGGQVGELFWTIIKDQFQRSRDADRFWYETYLDATTLATVRAQTLGAIIKRNCSIGNEMQNEVFHIPTAP